MTLRTNLMMTAFLISVARDMKAKSKWRCEAKAVVGVRQRLRGEEW